MEGWLTLDSTAPKRRGGCSYLLLRRAISQSQCKGTVRTLQWSGPTSLRRRKRKVKPWVARPRFRRVFLVQAHRRDPDDHVLVPELAPQRAPREAPQEALREARRGDRSSSYEKIISCRESGRAGAAWLRFNQKSILSLDLEVNFIVLSKRVIRQSVRYRSVPTLEYTRYRVATPSSY